MSAVIFILSFDDVNMTFFGSISVDSVPPVCGSIDDITQTLPLGATSIPVSWTEPQATDNCGPATLQSMSHTPGSFFTPGTTPVTYVFADGSGNATPCSFQVTILEPSNPPPVITFCPSDISSTTSCNAGGSTTPVTWQQPIATDNSGMVNLQSQSHQSGEAFPVGMTQVTYIFINPSGKTATCTFMVTITEGKLQDRYFQGRNA